MSPVRPTWVASELLPGRAFRRDSVSRGMFGMSYRLRSADRCTVISVHNNNVHDDPGRVTDLFEAIDDLATSRYVIDLSEATELDAAMIGFFLVFNGMAQRRGKGVAIVTGNAQVRDRLERLRIDTMMLVVDALDQAGVATPNSVS